MNTAPSAPDDLLRAINEPVHLLPWDDAWVERFSIERERLQALCPEFIAIEHIGSTSIPGMSAKPVIDLLAGVRDMSLAEALMLRLLGHGYTTSRAFNDMLPDRRWLMRAAGGHRTHHLHIVVHGGEVWHTHLQFRDAVRADADLAAEYLALKTALAAQHRDDRDAYTNGKDGFVRRVLSHCAPTRSTS